MKKNELMGILGCLYLLLFAAATFAAPVPDTGQAHCYDDVGNLITCPSPGQPFYGQDANYTINPMSYTKLDGNGNELPDSAMSWVMVRDNVTGLIWEMKTNLDGIQDYSDPHDADNTYTWYDSNSTTNGGSPGTPGDGTDTEDFIKAVNNASYGGFNDWRLPTVYELTSIANYENSANHAINQTYFPNTLTMPTSSYWSSNASNDIPELAWSVDFNIGNICHCYKFLKFYARAVRSGKSVNSVYVDSV